MRLRKLIEETQGGGGGGGGVLLKVYTYVGSGYILRFKILHFNIFWDCQKNIFFLGGGGGV